VDFLFLPANLRIYLIKINLKKMRLTQAPFGTKIFYCEKSIKPVKSRRDFPLSLRSLGRTSLPAIKYCKRKKEHNYFCTPLSLVVPTGAVSNFLLEDFMAVLKFMDAEIQKKKLSLK
jgi:hypothetical protein